MQYVILHVCWVPFSLFVFCTAVESWTNQYSEMEFLDINLTKDLSLFLNPIHSPFYWRILNKTTLLSGFKIITKNLRNKKTRVYS
jgi:hypothetical protein